MRYATLLLALMLGACNTKMPGSADEAPPTDHWSSDEPVVFGAVKARVAHAGVEPARVFGVQELADVFAVKLSIENGSPTQRHHYRTWASDATLVDNFGNHYKRLARPSDLGVREAPINPTAPVADVLLFETPITTAGYVDLHLPGDNVGASSGATVRLKLHTSGERLAAVRQAAAAFEAEQRARAAAIAAREAEAQRKVELARLEVEKARIEAEKRKAAAAAEAERLRIQEEKRKSEEAAATEQARIEEERRKEEAEIKALPGKLAAARQGLEIAQDKLKKIKAAMSSYVYSTPTPPEDYFNAKGQYIYYTRAQKAQRTSQLKDEVDRLTVEVAKLEARIAGSKNDAGK